MTLTHASFIDRHGLLQSFCGAFAGPTRPSLEKQSIEQSFVFKPVEPRPRKACGSGISWPRAYAFMPVPRGSQCEPWDDAVSFENFLISEFECTLLLQTGLTCSVWHRA